ncbi:hypothetical protein FOZ63_024602, partial [Perkinsus olseni]
QFVEPSNWDSWESSDICSLVLCGCSVASADRPVVILCDNVSAVAAINKLSAKSPRMNRLLRNLAKAWGYSRGLRAYHLPTQDNWLADSLSRQSPRQVEEYLIGASMSQIDMQTVTTNLKMLCCEEP